MRTNKPIRPVNNTPYPTWLPFEEIKDVVVIARAGEIIERLPDFIHALWVVQGYAQSQIIGSPVKAQSAEDLPATTAADDADAGLKELERVLAFSADESDEQIIAQGAISWVLIIKWGLPLLIQYLLSRR